jgi:beta-lactamase superfamily II metal-dependent hydrolase
MPLRHSTRRAIVPLLVPILAVAWVPSARAGEIQVHFIDVGQGASALVIGPGGTRVLIDGANPGDGSAKVVPYLQSIGVTDLDYSFMSHWHQDHYGGMDEVFNAGFKPNVAAYDRGDFQKPTGSQVTGYLNSVTGVRATPVLGQVVPLGDGAEIAVVGLNGTTLGGNTTLQTPYSGNEENGASIALWIRYKDFDCYVAGDITAGGLGTPDVESKATGYVGQVEVAQASHHGSFSSSSAAVIGNLNPSFVVYSCGEANPYGHPHVEVVNGFNKPSASRVTWSTTEGDATNNTGGFGVADGAIVVRSDGTTFSAGRSSGPETIRFATFENPGIAPAVGSLAVSELLVDPQVAQDQYGEWWEITGLSPSPVDLAGVQFQSGTSSFTIASRVLLAQGERLVFGLDGRPSRNGEYFLGHGAPWQLFSLSNASSSLSVKAPSLATIETVSWGGANLPVVSGSTQEREDLLAAATPPNFTTASAPWGSGTDDGSPWGANAVDSTAWGASLGTNLPKIGQSLTFYVDSLDEPGTLYFLGLSAGFFPGFDVFGFHLSLNADAVFLVMTSYPGTFGALDAAGKKTLAIPLPVDQNLVGFTGFSQFFTLVAGPGGLTGSKLSNLAPFTIGQ